MTTQLTVKNHTTGTTEDVTMTDVDFENFFNRNDRDHLAAGKEVFWGARIDGVPTKFSGVIKR